MSIEKTKKQLSQLLGNPDNLVIALSGRWGTGKTHLWNEVKDESHDDKVKNALYASLFGLSSIDQIKRKLIETAIPGMENHGGKFAALKNLLQTGVKAASSHYKALAAINDLNLLLMAPVLLRNKWIVIDDIERKHDKLGIDEVLGFIDEYSKQYGTRFVLVLNDDQLSAKDDQKKLWQTFREKVIDQEIKLSTTAEQAFAIAIGLRPSKYANEIKRAIIVCKLTNIRVLVKVIATVNLILAEQQIVDAVQSRVVPSIVLFSAIHYRGMDNGPDFKFALNVGNPDWVRFLDGNKKQASPEEKQEESWRGLMHELGIAACDEFEKYLVEFLESGLFDVEAIKAVVSRYTAETEAMEARESARKFIMRAGWAYWVTEDQLLIEATALSSKAGLLNPFLATQLQSDLTKLSGGAGIGDTIINNWIMDFKKTNQSNVDDENPFGNPIHPSIQAEFDKVKVKAQASVSVIEACMYIVQNSGWGTSQQVALQLATAADFEAAIREIRDISQLRRFMNEMIKMRQQRATYDDCFGTATERFVEACRALANDKQSPRLANLVKRLFQDAHLEFEIVPQIQVANRI
jgi:KAP family P-loop domain